eukprot:53638_1
MKSYNRNNTRRNSRKAIKLCMNNIRKITDESHSRSNKAQREQGNIVEQICGQNAARITIKVAYSNCKRQHKNCLKLFNNTEQEHCHNAFISVVFIASLPRDIRLFQF